ncbi:MAG: hypothetical protein DCC67_03125 [Planctomycetota bacterium]|nr:MAG: hypothetical protein DCC67_03125 [Planctomycetota bacterium]
MLIPLLAETTVIREVTYSGIGIGSVVAAVCSWERNKSIILAAIAAFFTWLYVIYFALTRRPGEYKA